MGKRTNLDLSYSGERQGGYNKADCCATQPRLLEPTLDFVMALASACRLIIAWLPTPMQNYGRNMPPLDVLVHTVLLDRHF
jgi:hypothetical protein